MQQVAVRTMNLNHAEASADRALRRRRKGFYHLLDALLVERFRCLVMFAEGDGARGNDLPGTIIFRVERPAAEKRGDRARLPSGMRKLDSRRRSHALEKARNACKRFDVTVLPDAKISRRDAPLRRHCGRLD